MNTAYRFGRAIQAGRVWTNCYHDTQHMLHSVDTNMSGIGRENHLMMLGHYQQTKCILVGYNKGSMGFLLKWRKSLQQ